MIAKITSWFDLEGRQVLPNHEIVWVRGEGNKHHFNVDEIILGKATTLLDYAATQDHDKFEIVPDDQVPAEVWTEIAARQLMP